MSLALALSLAVQLTVGSSADLLLQAGDQAPPFAMRDIKKKVFSLRDHTGPEASAPRQAVVVSFFATWCKPCVKELPILKRLQKQWKRKGVEIISIGLSQSERDLAPFVKKQRLPWRVVPDSYGLLGRRYGVSQLPHLFIIDRDGRVAFQHQGLGEDLQATLVAQLKRITSGKGGEDLEVAVSEPRFTRTLTFGRAPSGGGSISRWRPMAMYVSEKLETNVDLTHHKTYEAFEAALKKGELDIANAGPMLLHNVRDQYEPVARVERQSSPVYFGIIFTKRDAPMTSVADLKGKKIGLVSKLSTSGGLFAQLALMQAGLDPSRDVTIEWLGSHSKVAEAVASGAVDAGGCYEDCRDVVWPGAVEKARNTKVLAYTPEIPGETIVVRRSLDDATKSAIKEALLELPKQEGILAQISQNELAITNLLPAGDIEAQKLQEVMELVSQSGSKAGAAAAPAAAPKSAEQAGNDGAADEDGDEDEDEGEDAP